MNSFRHDYRVIVIGAGGAIGSAFVAALEADPKCQVVSAVGRSTDPAIDFDQPDTIEDAASQLQPQAPFDLIIDATGLLHEGATQPEKSLRHLEADNLERLFRINTVGPALLLRHFTPLLPRKERGVFASLSARVGSIGDNRLGGWYGYRASKAALNMMIKSASIELSRSRPHSVCLALHPGTVISPLSDPFSGDRDRFTPQECAENLLSVIDMSGPEKTGQFLAYDGSTIDW
ncbi:MAG: SDR family NAD(P)-dependent oxidoreductase [Pseudomonadota bacterium]